MNYVNLIGKMSSEPKMFDLENGKKIVNFSLKTEETYIDKDGNAKKRSQWHRISAWGKWTGVIQEFGTKGMNMAVEGRLISRFYKTPKGEKRIVTEIEVNDLVLL